MNFQQVTLAGKEVASATYVAPMSSASFALPAGATNGSVGWKIISDYGGVGALHTSGQ